MSERHRVGVFVVSTACTTKRKPSTTVAEELKTLDRKIVLNSMILKWENIEKEFKELIKI